MANALYFGPLDVRAKWYSVAKKLCKKTEVLGVFTLTMFVGKQEPSITGQFTFSISLHLYLFVPGKKNGRVKHIKVF